MILRDFVECEMVDLCDDLLCDGLFGIVIVVHIILTVMRVKLRRDGNIRKEDMLLI